MIEAVGNQVVALARIRFGPLALGTLPEGKARRLRPPGGQAALEGCGGMSERLYAVRGATKVSSNDVTAILDATEELMRELISRNDLEPDRIVSCLFTATADLNAEFPAVAARRARARCGAIAVRSRAGRSRRDARGDPGHGPLLRRR